MSSHSTIHVIRYRTPVGQLRCLSVSLQGKVQNMVLFGQHFTYFLARAYGARHSMYENILHLRRIRTFDVFRPKAAEKTGHLF